MFNLWNECNLTCNEIISNYPNAAAIKLFDSMGVFGELPLTECNLSGKADGYHYNEETKVLKIYVS